MRINEPTSQPIALDVPTYLKNEVHESFSATNRLSCRRLSPFPASRRFHTIKGVRTEIMSIIHSGPLLHTPGPHARTRLPFRHTGRFARRSSSIQSRQRPISWPTPYSRRALPGPIRPLHVRTRRFPTQPHPQSPLPTTACRRKTKKTRSHRPHAKTHYPRQPPPKDPNFSLAN